MDGFDDSPARSNATALVAVPSAGSTLTREIVVNGERCRVGADEISHTQLVKLAFPDLPESQSTRELTISYRGGPHTAPDGILAPGERTPLANGETFVVTRTNKS